MASIVAYIELREGCITRPSRFVVAEARRVADTAGATVYALLAVGDLRQDVIDQLALEMSAAGADRILCSSAEALAGPPLNATHGPLLALVAERLRPVLFLFPAGGTGTELGPSLALRIGAAYLPNASVDIVSEERGVESRSQRILLTRWRAARDALRRIDVGDFERPVVASLSCGTAPARLGEPCAEVEMLPCPEPGLHGVRLLAQAKDSTATPEVCSALVWSDAALPAGSRARLPSELPVGAAMVSGIETLSGVATSPRELFLLSPCPRADIPPLSLLAPGALAVELPSKPEVPA
jgi:hypothetical protein